MWKDFFYFSRSDRRALAFFVSVIMVTTVVRLVRPEPEPEDYVVTEAEDTVLLGRRSAASQETGTLQAASAVDVDVRVRRPDSVRTARPVFRRQEKYPYGTVLDLNAVDTTELKKVPGIGSYFARRIVEYRSRLGGYVSPEQILEVDERIADTVTGWFLVRDTFSISRIPVNSASVSQMKAHPYIDFYMARAIADYRRKYGKIENPAQLSLLDEFAGQDMERLSRYLSFE